jgi:hypothetical protein
MGHVADWALTAKLISTLFAHTEKLGDLNDSKELRRVVAWFSRAMNSS